METIPRLCRYCGNGAETGGLCFNPLKEVWFHLDCLLGILHDTDLPDDAFDKEDAKEIAEDMGLI